MGRALLGDQALQDILPSGLGDIRGWGWKQECLLLGFQKVVLFGPKLINSDRELLWNGDGR